MNNSLKPYLRFKEFDDSWREIQLGDIGSFKNGLNKGAEDFGFGVPFINLLDVFGKTEIDNPELKLVNASLRDIATYTVKKGDVFFIRSSVKRSGVGETVVARRDLENTVYSGFLIRYRATEQLNNNFKKYCFWTEGFRLLLVRFSTSSANTNINQESLSQLKLFIPKVDEQQKIADFLTVVDSKICQLTEKHRLLKEYKKGVMHQLFSQKIRFKDDDGKAFPDWNEDRLDSFIQRVNDPVDVEQTKKYRQIGIRCHGKGLFHKDKVTGAELGNKRVFWVHTKALIINIVFAWERAVAVTSESENGFVASHRFPMFVPIEGKSDLDYLLYFFLSPRGEYLLNLASPGGAGRNKTLGQAEFARLKLNLPSLAEQLKIAQFLQSIDKKVDAVALQIEQTKLFKKGLLQQMFV
ncbi:MULTISPECIES: restriction endonuclease subunit S [Shewanella]|uniref:restriction endonuclease subunit S n=1 Tax=Shewanella TaxID=22 RepID=UPI001BB86FB9|nr:restriction endonuclease subunit S [Shewanella morhuae]GIU03644.1 hypothetical protein TUM4641_10000 [Shewanella morhuae]